VTIAVTEIISDWACSLSFKDIPSRTVTCAKEQVIGIIAAILAGSRTEECRPLYKALKIWSGSEESTVIGAAFKTNMRDAGMVNAIVAQTLEWEDYLRSQHTGASTVPNALAVGEAFNASGKQFLTGLIAGNEICGRTGHAYIKSHLFTNSCPNHQIDAAIVAGKIMGLDKEQMMDALGISCFPPMTQSFAGWFSPTKGLITGAPVHAGITGACLAKAGFKGFRQIIEHPDGFSSAIFERYDLEEMVKDLGTDWRTDTHSPKVYPCCGWLDALIDSALDIIHGNKVDWQEIASVQVQCPTVTLLLNKPRDELMQLIDRIATTDYLTCVPLFFDSIYPLAVAIIDGELTPAQFSRERITDSSLHAFFDKIHFVVDPTLDVKEMQEGINSGGVKITLKNGTEYHKFTEAMKGSYKNPIDIREKLYLCTSEILSNQQREEIYDTAMKMEKLDNIRDFTALLL